MLSLRDDDLAFTHDWTLTVLLTIEYTIVYYIGNGE